MNLMPHQLKIVLVLALVALLPLRALASVTIGFCASGHHEQPVAAHGAHGDHGDHAHDGAEDQHGKPAAPTCNVCAEHCSNAAFAPDGVARAVAASAVSEASTGVTPRAAPAFVPDQRDRPPLA
jgi:hypothetical protein